MQFMRINDNVSKVSDVSSRVPQGSVLGPIMYLIYVNNVGYVNLSSKLIKFADEMVLVNSHLDPAAAAGRLSDDLARITDHFSGLKPSQNKSKTKILYIERRIERSSFNSFRPLKLDGVVIEAVEDFN